MDVFNQMAGTLVTHGVQRPEPPKRQGNNQVGTRTGRMREALRLRGPLDTDELARVAQVSRADVWALLKQDVRLGRIVRVKGSKPLRLKLVPPPVLTQRLSFFELERCGYPDAETTVLLSRADVDEPWGGWWDDEARQWRGLDGMPCEVPTHWADWPKGVQ